MMTNSDALTGRQLILEVAARLFVQHGYHGISMREIAAEVQLSKAGLYYYFRDKEALFLAILSDHLERVAAIVAQARVEHDTARARIHQVMAGIFQQAPTQRSIIRLASQDMGSMSEGVREEFQRLYDERLVGQVEAILQEGMAQGELREMDSRLATWMLLGMAYPFFYPAHQQALRSSDDPIDLMLTLFFDGAARS